MMMVRHILVGVDFSREADAAIQCAFSFARAFDARVTLLHVHELPSMLSPIVPGADSATDTAALRDRALQGLDALRERLHVADPRTLEGAIAIDIAVEGGDPATAILSRVRAGGIDLVVMGTHGRTGLRRLLVGSVTEAVVRRAGCPVVAVHLPSM